MRSKFIKTHIIYAVLAANKHARCLKLEVITTNSYFSQFTVSTYINKYLYALNVKFLHLPKRTEEHCYVYEMSIFYVRFAYTTYKVRK